MKKNCKRTVKCWKMTVQSVDGEKKTGQGILLKRHFKSSIWNFTLYTWIFTFHLKFQVSHIILEIQVSHIAFERENASLEVLSFLLPSLILVFRDEWHHVVVDLYESSFNLYFSSFKQYMSSFMLLVSIYIWAVSNKMNLRKTKQE